MDVHSPSTTNLTFDEAPIGMVLCTPDGRILKANHVYLNMLGYTLEELTSQDSSRFTHPDDVASTRAFVASLQDGSRATGYLEKRYIRKDGQIVWVRSSVTMRRDKRGVPTQLIAIIEDITERKKAEEALRTSEERLTFALEAAGGIGAWDWDIPNDRFYCNAAFAHLFSVDPERATVGAPIAEFFAGVHPDDRPRIGEKLHLTLSTGGDYAEEYRVLPKYGPIRWIHARGRCHRDESGNPTRFPGVVLDITERKKAEAALAERARLSELGADVGAALARETEMAQVLRRCAEAIVQHLSAACAAIWTLDTESEVLTVQAIAGLPHIFEGHPARMAAGTAQATLIAQGRRPCLFNELVRYETANDPSWIRGEGIVSFAGYPLLIEGRTIGVIGLFARRKLGQETLTALESIAGSIALGIERKRTEEELRRTNHELEEFAYVASHDLQEPLRMVGLYSQLLLERVNRDDPTLNLFAGYIKEGVLRMDALIQDLLTFSRTVHTRESVVGTADLSAAFEQALSLVKRGIEESGAVLVVAQPLPKVRGEEAQMVHVFQNLLSNALKYRKGDKRPEICIGSELCGEYWVVSVQDNGIGFEQRYAERIFGLFKRLHKDEYPGTGLGLAICQRIVQRFGGRMWAEGRPEKGATFYFSLPRAEEGVSS